MSLINLILLIRSSHSLGTSHSDELEFLFYPKLYRNYRIEPPASDSIEHRLIQTFTEFWSSFAKTG